MNFLQMIILIHIIFSSINELSKQKLLLYFQKMHGKPRIKFSRITFSTIIRDKLKLYNFYKN